MSDPDNQHALPSSSFPTGSIPACAGPLRLIFWGIILCIIKIELDNFDIVNDFVGMSLILWGTVSLSRIPVSVSYRRRMLLLVVLAMTGTVFSFFNAVLLPFRPEWSPDPSLVCFALLVLTRLAAVGGLFLFCRCMKEYCALMNREKALASWKYSARLLFFGVFVPLCILFFPLCLFFDSLNFTPKNPSPISWKSRYDGEEMHFSAYRDGKIIYSETFPKPQKGEPFTYTYPQLDPPDHDGWRFEVGEWHAPIDGALAWGAVLPTTATMLVFCWAILHFLMSLSRTIRSDASAVTGRENAPSTA